jgi:hypothetical protein
MERRMTWLRLMVVVLLLALALPLSVSADAIVYRYNDVQVPVSGWVPNLCGGEWVYIDGVAHFSGHTVITGNKARFNGHLNGQGVSGVGLTSGAKYNYPISSHFSDSFNNQFTTYSGIYVFSEKLIGQGPNNNMVVTSQFHYTFDFSTGEFRVLVDNFRIDCH